MFHTLTTFGNHSWTREEAMSNSENNHVRQNPFILKMDFSTQHHTEFQYGANVGHKIKHFDPPTRTNPLGFRSQKAYVNNSVDVYREPIFAIFFHFSILRLTSKTPNQVPKMFHVFQARGIQSFSIHETVLIVLVLSLMTHLLLLVSNL